MCCIMMNDHDKFRANPFGDDVWPHENGPYENCGNPLCALATGAIILAGSLLVDAVKGCFSKDKKKK